jgi:serine/threonine protein kinase
MAVASRKEFIACITKSNVIGAEKLNDWLSTVDDQSPKKIAIKLVRDKLLTPWQAKFLIAGRSRLIVGNYVLQARISSDELGDKFEALHKNLNRKVVIQFFPSTIAQNASLLKELLEKIQQITELDHPNLIHVYDVDHENDRYFLVTEYVKGQSLDSIPAQQVSETNVARIIAGIANGLVYAHQCDIVHGNVNAQNIIVTATGDAALQGFPSATLTGQTNASLQQPNPTDDLKNLVRIGLSLLQQLPDKARSNQHPELSRMFLGLAEPQTRTKGLKRINNWVLNHATQSQGSKVLSQMPGYSSLSHRPGSESASSDVSIEQANVATKDSQFSVNQNDRSETKTDSSNATSLPRNLINTRKPRPSSNRWPHWIALAGMIAVLLVGGLTAMGTLFSSTDVPSHVVDSGTSDAPPADTGNAVATVPDGVPADSPKKHDGNVNLANDSHDTITHKLEAAADTLITDRLVLPGDEVLNPDTNRQKLKDFFAKRDGKQSDLASQNAADQSRGPNGKRTPPSTKNADSPQSPLVKNPVSKKKSKPESLSAKAKTSKSASQRRPTKEKPSKETPPLGHDSFALFPARFDLPDPTNTSDLKIGNLVLPSNSLLGLELLAQPIIARGKIDFRMQRSLENKQLWNVDLHPKRGDHVTVAQFQKTANAFLFRWLPEAAQREEVNYLRNAKIKLFTPQEFAWVGLRKPVVIRGFSFQPDATTAQAMVSLDWLPNAEAMKIQLQPFTTGQKDDDVGFAPREITAKSPARIFFRKKQQDRFFFIEVVVNVRKKLTFEAKMKLRLPNETTKHVRYHSDIKSFSDAIGAEKIRADRQVKKSRGAAKPKNLDAKEFAKLKSEIAKRARDVNRALGVSRKYTGLARKLAGIEIPVLIYFDMDGHRIEIAKSDSK